MKRLFVLSLVAVLGVGLLSVGALAQQPNNTKSYDTYVEWNINAPLNCNLSVQAHDGVDLGTLEQVDRDYEAAAQGEPTDVTVTSNCVATLNVKATGLNVPVSNTEFFSDFLVKVKSTSNAHAASSFGGPGEGNWENFTSIGSMDSASLALGEMGDDSYGNSIDGTWTMDYQYHTDFDDENTYYRVNLLYTASTS